MKKREDIIASTLGLRPLADIENEKALPIEHEEDVVSSTEITVPNNNQEIIDDIEHARKNIQNIITQGDDALSEMMELAKQSESPRAFEVASTLMKTLLDANKDFVEMANKKKWAIEETKGGRQETNVTNNNLIVSTSDLLRMLKGQAND
jgi:hypothetical protein